MPKTVPQSDRDRLYAHLSQVARSNSTLLPKYSFSSSPSQPSDPPAPRSTATVSATSSGGANTLGWGYPRHSVLTGRGYLGRGRARAHFPFRAGAFGGRGGRAASTGGGGSERLGHFQRSESGSLSADYDSSSDGWGDPPHLAEAEARATSISNLGPSDHGTGTRKKHDTHDTRATRQKRLHEKHEQPQNPPLHHKGSTTPRTGSFGHCSSCVTPSPTPSSLTTSRGSSPTPKRPATWSEGNPSYNYDNDDPDLGIPRSAASREKLRGLANTRYPVESRRMASRDKTSAITAALEEIRRVMGERIDQGYDQSPRHGSRGHDEHEGRTRTYDSRDSGLKEVDSLREENRGYRKQVGMLEQRLEELSGRIKDIDSARAPATSSQIRELKLLLRDRDAALSAAESALTNARSAPLPSHATSSFTTTLSQPSSHSSVHPSSQPHPNPSKSSDPRSTPFQTSPTSSALLGAQNEIDRLTRLLSAQKALIEESTRQRQLAEAKASSATKHQSTIQREKNELETKFVEIEGRLEGEIKRREEVEGKLRVAETQTRVTAEILNRMSFFNPPRWLQAYRPTFQKGSNPALQHELELLRGRLSTTIKDRDAAHLKSRSLQTECAKALDKVREIRRQADGLQKRNQELLEQRQGEEKLSSDKAALKKALKEQSDETERIRLERRKYKTKLAEATSIDLQTQASERLTRRPPTALAHPRPNGDDTSPTLSDAFQPRKESSVRTDTSSAVGAGPVLGTGSRVRVGEHPLPERRREGADERHGRVLRDRRDRLMAPLEPTRIPSPKPYDATPTASVVSTELKPISSIFSSTGVSSSSSRLLGSPLPPAPGPSASASYPAPGPAAGIATDVFSDLTALAAQDLQSSVRASRRSMEAHAVLTPNGGATFAAPTAAPELTTVHPASPTLLSISPQRDDPFAGLGEVFDTIADSTTPRKSASAIVV
ncbi:hypothetical protein JCM24511_01552 [Saitozyma sp. JCM 24511]|nr:hypothetical protein JCM24511_01552 [Saitozyma sp. JCM 24511]